MKTGQFNKFTLYQVFTDFSMVFNYYSFLFHELGVLTWKWETLIKIMIRGEKRSNFKILEYKDLFHSIPGGSMIQNLPTSAGDVVQCLTQENWRKWQPTPVSLPGKFHRQRSLPGCTPESHKESDTTKRLSTLESVFIKLVAGSWTQLRDWEHS